MVAHYNKQNKIDGIYCDLCGALLQNKFSYYSGAFSYVEVDRESGQNGIKNIDDKLLNVDYCEKCWGELKDRMLKTLQEVDKQKHKEKLHSNWETTTEQPTKKLNMSPGKPMGKRPIKHKQRFK